MKTHWSGTSVKQSILCTDQKTQQFIRHRTYDRKKAIECASSQKFLGTFLLMKISIVMHMWRPYVHSTRNIWVYGINTNIFSPRGLTSRCITHPRSSSSGLVGDRQSLQLRSQYYLSCVVLLRHSVHYTNEELKAFLVSNELIVV